MIIHPESSQLMDDLIEEIDEAHIQLSKQFSRLEELAILKKQSPGKPYQVWFPMYLMDNPTVQIPSSSSKHSYSRMWI